MTTKNNAPTGANGKGMSEDETELVAPTGSREEVVNRQAAECSSPINDAILIGTPCDEFEALMTREVTFLTGVQFPEKPHKSTKSGGWREIIMTWADHIKGAPAEGGCPAYGLSRHPVGKSKDGHCIVFGSSIGGERKAAAMHTMPAIVLDIDSGASYDDVLAKVLDMGVAATMHTSWNHRKRGLELNRDEVLRKLRITQQDLPDDGLTDEHVRSYLRSHSKNRFEEAFIEAVTVAGDHVLTSEGIKVRLDTPPIEKFRVVFPLAETLTFKELAKQEGTQRGALGLWEDKITGLARNHLGVHFDTSCTDPSRLFFTARHAKGRDDWRCHIVQGKPLRFEDIEPMKKAEYLRSRVSGGDVFAEAGRGVEDIQGSHLKRYAVSHGQRLRLSELVRDLCPERVLTTKGALTVVECPHKDGHSDDKDGSGFLQDADGLGRGFEWGCHRNSCSEYDRLDHLAKALADGWFDEEALFDAAYLWSEDEGEDDTVVVDDDTSPGRVSASKDPLARAGEITAESSEDDVRKLFRFLIRRNVDQMDKARVIEDIASRTPLGKRQLTKLWEQQKRAQASVLARREGEPLILPSETGADEMVAKTLEALRTANKGQPVLFHHEVGLAKVKLDARRGARIENLESRDALAHTINELRLFGKQAGHGEDQKVISDFAPDAVVQHIWNSPHESYALPLHGLRTTPYFDRHGELVHENGYHPGSKIVLVMPEGATLDHVGAEWTPSEAEVDAAVWTLAELFADFPLDALTRQELLDRLQNAEETPSFCALLAFVMLPFMREMIDGPTPGHFFTKPAPGTGASLLVETTSIISQGEEIASWSLPESREEVDKTLTTIFSGGGSITYFDNIDHSVDSGALASAMTKRRHAARLLGKTYTVDVPVRTIWGFSGNNVTMSGELLRRCIPIQLDARLPDPSQGRTFQIDDIKGYVRNRRWELVSACLTIIQNWIAKGQPQFTGRPLSSFEDWSRKVGGVLEAARLPGFMANVTAWKVSASDGREEDARRLLRELCEHPDGTIFRAKGKNPPKGAPKEAQVVAIIDLLNASNDSEEGPIRLDGTSYKELLDDDGIRLVYSHPRKLTKVVSNLARVPHKFDVDAADGQAHEVVLRLDERTDTKNGSTYWVKVADDPARPDVEAKAA